MSKGFTDMVGSPPHTRGTGGIHGVVNCSHGITPAYAGNRKVEARARFLAWDHPRIRGEQEQKKSESSEAAGSPPHTRGTGGIHGVVNCSHGITPA